MKNKKIVDLSWEFTAETPIYPGDRNRLLQLLHWKTKVTIYHIGNGNTGRALIDAPYHFPNSGETIDNMELDFFLGEAVVAE